MQRLLPEFDIASALDEIGPLPLPIATYPSQITQPQGRKPRGFLLARNQFLAIWNQKEQGEEHALLSIYR